MPETSRQITDLEKVWEARLWRVRRSQARANVAGMTRPSRDPAERAFLTSIDRLGPFAEGQSCSSPSSSSASVIQSNDTT